MARFIFDMIIALVLAFYLTPILTQLDVNVATSAFTLDSIDKAESTSEESDEWIDDVPDEDPERDNLISLQRAGSLEAIVLEAIRRGGSELCSSPFVRGVMLGTWRNGTPDYDEMRDTRELRRTCYNALLKTEYTSTTTPIPSLFSPFQRGLPANRSTERPASNSSLLETDELVFALKPAPAPNARMSRLGPSARPSTSGGQYSAADQEVMQKMNDIIKDRSADCKPRKIPVEIPVENNITWKPACTLVERCGGCCQHVSLHCVPTKDGIGVLKKKVVAMDSKGTLIGVKQVSIEKHNKCKCQCKIQAKDCNELQTYDSRNCRCLCKQSSSKTGGRSSCTPPLYWDERSCKCRCPEKTITECSTGSYFSSERCRCVTALDIIKDESKRIRQAMPTE